MSANDIVGAQRRMTDITGLLRQMNAIAEKREGVWVALQFLAFKAREINGCPMQTWGRAGFHASHVKTQFTQTFGQGIAGKFTGPASLDGMVTDMYPSTEEGTGRQNHRPTAIPEAGVIGHPHDPAVFNLQPLDHGLLEIQARRLLQNAFHSRMVTRLVVLGTRRVNRRPFFGVQRAILDSGLVGDPGHLATKRIDFLDQLAFGHAPDGRTAGHGRHFVQIDDRQKNGASHARRRQGRFTAGVAGANDDDVVCSGKGCHRVFMVPVLFYF